MLGPEGDTKSGDHAGDDVRRSLPRAIVVSGVAEESVPALFASASRLPAGLDGALAELGAASSLAATPPLGVRVTDLSTPRELVEHSALHVAVEGVSLVAARLLQDSRFVSSVVPPEIDIERGIAELPDTPAPLRAKVRDAALALHGAYQALVERGADRITARDRVPPAAALAAARELAVGLVPAATRTSVYLSANARTLASRCHKLLAHPLPEVVATGRAVLDAARAAASDVFTHADASPSKMRMEAPGELSRAVARLYAAPQEGSSATMVISQPVRLVRHDKDALERIVLALAYEGSDPSVHAFALLGSLRVAKEAPLLEVLQAVLRERSAGELVPRGFEASTMTFEIMTDAATTHELLRHRAHTAATQRLTCRLGFQTPEELIDLGLAEAYQDAMLAAQAAWGEIEAEDPLVAEYVVPLGYRLRSLWTLDLRQLVHVVEARSRRGNPTRVRRIAHGLYRTAGSVLPWLRDVARADLD